MIETGKVLQQRYRIEKQIGQGGMGAVYVATDERFGSTVAIKETLFMDDNYRKAIEREARLLNSLKHIALPRVTDHFLEENGQFLVMEYIAGEDLHHRMETTGRPFPVDQVLTWANQLLEALDFLHNQVNPVIHRDIKPQNLKVTPKGQIILLDFGLAKGNPTDAGHHTAAKSIFGYSRNYASLEQIQGTGTDPRSDLYSLAATLYHLLTNSPPEDALTRAMAVLAHRPDPLVPANRLVPEIPAGVAGVLQKALDLNASGRPESAAAMRAMLRDHEKYESLAASAAAATVPHASDIHNQHTKLMPGSTRAVGGETDVKTEVMLPPLSQLTEPAVDTSSDGKRRFGFVGAGLAAAVLLGSIAGGAYLIGPEMFDHETAQPEAQTEAQAEAAAPPAVEPVVEDKTLATNVNAGAVAPPAVEEVTRPSTSSAASTATAKTSEPSKPARNQGGAKADPEVHLNSGKIVIDGDTVYMGNTKITPDGRIETPDRVITGSGVNRTPITPIPPPDMRGLTPQQRRQVLRAIRRSGVVIQPAPSPKY
ncbi:MAG TPA: serine/threonine-protein kinase [Pyrinomonadaceae bacterium]